MSLQDVSDQNVAWLLGFNISSTVEYGRMVGNSCRIALIKKKCIQHQITSFIVKRLLLTGPVTGKFFREAIIIRVDAHIFFNFSNHFQIVDVQKLFYLISFWSIFQKCICFHKIFLKNNEENWQKSPYSLFWKWFLWKNLPLLMLVAKPIFPATFHKDWQMFLAPLGHTVLY